MKILDIQPAWSYTDSFDIIALSARLWIDLAARRLRD